MKHQDIRISEREIIYEDDDILVIDKPAGISTHPLLPNEKNTLIQQLLRIRPEIKDVDPQSNRPGIVHRLDRNTSGLVVVAKTKKAYVHLAREFASRRVEKRYVALARGRFADKEGRIKSLMGRNPANRKKQKVFSVFDPQARRQTLREALTEWRVLKNFSEWTLIEALPKTGRRHQIRAHLASIGHPIAGDTLYAFKNMPRPEGLTRHFLHASRLKLTLPSKTVKEFNSPLPEELQQVLDNLQ